MTTQTQDLPPPGGFPTIKYKRNVPRKGPSGFVLFSAMFAICTYGFYKLGQANVEKRELQREKVWSRIYLVPLLQAELDRDSYRRSLATLAKEEEIMKDVPGWKVGESVYNNKKRFIPPSIVVIPEH
ncbi:24436_t:CDS:2 [Entrophospora sp. SA101]|nr:3389_t:CDS:2 [Entrophospora candida]CAH1756158.1 14954_t:CDS:2 [Entrophospora sp. SA101]CAG8438811.1 5541_t:CDS:2 [Entrophospora candida]CAJ0649789.1 3372_t:CDS:2 [Entrophospora sp. SA101]CAJ0757639.1 24436_t:CDS:2 [Entrophospora sp. SA101]